MGIPTGPLDHSAHSDHDPGANTAPARTRGEPLPGDVAQEWNAGTLACGDLVLALRARLGAMPPGAVLRLTAVDPGAPADLPAWCRITGHALLAADHPVYLIRRRAER